MSAQSTAWIQRAPSDMEDRQVDPDQKAPAGPGIRSTRESACAVADTALPCDSPCALAMTNDVVRDRVEVVDPGQEVRECGAEGQQDMEHDTAQELEQPEHAMSTTSRNGRRLRVHERSDLPYQVSPIGNGPHELDACPGWT